MHERYPPCDTRFWKTTRTTRCLKNRRHTERIGSFIVQNLLSYRLEAYNVATQVRQESRVLKINQACFALCAWSLNTGLPNFHRYGSRPLGAPTNTYLSDSNARAAKAFRFFFFLKLSHTGGVLLLLGSRPKKTEFYLTSHTKCYPPFKAPWPWPARSSGLKSGLYQQLTPSSNL